jgi:hypothetical protein
MASLKKPSRLESITLTDEKAKTQFERRKDSLRGGQSLGA